MLLASMKRFFPKLAHKYCHFVNIYCIAVFVIPTIIRVIYPFPDISATALLYGRMDGSLL